MYFDLANCWAEFFKVCAFAFQDFLETCRATSLLAELEDDDELPEDENDDDEENEDDYMYEEGVSLADVSERNCRGKSHNNYESYFALEGRRLLRDSIWQASFLG
jgi:hypothetical protein